MFSLLLYQDSNLRLEKNWFGIGAIKIIDERGARRIHPAQANVLIAVLESFKSYEQAIDPNNLRCNELCKYFAYRFKEHADNLTWRTLYQSDLKELGRRFAEE
ncbi:MAG: hypothetical protein ACAH10_03760 [Methylophilaceae bacterium]